MCNQKFHFHVQFIFHLNALHFLCMHMRSNISPERACLSKVMSCQILFKQNFKTFLSTGLQMQITVKLVLKSWPLQLTKNFLTIFFFFFFLKWANQNVFKFLYLSFVEILSYVMI